MRFTIPAAITGALLLTACGGGESVSLKNVSADQVDVAKINKLQPGQWEVTAEVVKQETTGGMKGLPEMPKSPPSTTKMCITPEQAERPEAMFGKGMDQFKKSCVYDKFEMSGGKLNTEMHCDLQGGIKVKATGTGTFSATEMTSDSSSEVNMPGGMTVKSQVKTSARRLGECQPGDQQAGAAPKAG